MKKVLIAVPSGTMVHANFCTSLAMLMRKTDKNRFGIGLTNVKSSNIAMSRNACIKAAVDSGAEYLLFIDSDMSFPAESLEILYNDMSASGAVIVGASYCMRQPPFRNLAIGIAESEDGKANVSGLVEAARLPTGMMLIDLRILSKLSKPYFAIPLRDNPDGEGDLLGEDYYFCDKVREAGGTIMLDTDLSFQMIHWGEMGVVIDDTPQGYKHITDSEFKF